jgi:hypothetical protein
MNDGLGNMGDLKSGGAYALEIAMLGEMGLFWMMLTTVLRILLTSSCGKSSPSLNGPMYGVVAVFYWVSMNWPKSLSDTFLFALVGIFLS